MTKRVNRKGGGYSRPIFLFYCAKPKYSWPVLLLYFKVAGGLASGQSVMDCAYKESEEEASVPEHILKNLKPCGTVR